MSTERYLFQLQSLDPNQRREAILALSLARDTRALQPLEKIISNDPELTIRDLAAQVIREIEDEQWQQFAQKPDEPVVKAVRVDQPEVEVSAAKKRAARGHLTHAFSYHNIGDDVNGLAELADAIKVDPNLANDKVAQNLAAELMGHGPYPEQAMAMVLQAMQEGKIKHLKKPLLDDAERRLFAIAVVGAILLLIALDLFVTAYFFNLRGGVGQIGSANPLKLLPAVFKISDLSKNLPFTAGFLFTVLIGDSAMYYVGSFLGGIGTYLRFLAVILMTQFIIVFFAAFGFVFLPIFTVLGSGDGTSAVRINIVAVGIGLFWNVMMQSFFAARVHRVNLHNGILMVFTGILIAALLGILLGGFTALGF
jgi:hypothetical protein